MKSQENLKTEDVARELTVAEDGQEAAGRRIQRALSACPNLRAPSSERDAVWLTVQTEICTSGTRFVTPFGSSAPVMITEDQATDELLSAMEWLMEHQTEARALSPLRLFVMLRGVATRSKGGSARAAQADRLHGLTEVPSGRPIRWTSLDEPGAA